MIIFTVIAVACVASGLAYTAMVINSDNSSSAEYGLVSFEYDGTPATAAQIFSSEGVSLMYDDEGKQGSVYFEFTLSSLKANSVSEWFKDGTYVEVCCGDKIYTKEFSSSTDSSITVVGDALVFDVTTAPLEKDFKIRLSDDSLFKTSDFSDSSFHLTVTSHNLEIIS